MKRFGVFRHVFAQPFLVAVSFAAAIHSSWSFSTLFTGLEPHPQFSAAWFSWIVPGVMLAFSVDIGLLSLANQIRLGQRTRGRLLAFAVLCMAMGFLQFLYIAAHMPEVVLGAGVRSDWVGLVSLLRDASIWVLPTLLPTALILFAFSEETVHTVVDATTTALVPTTPPIVIEKPAKISMKCPDCDWRELFGSQPEAVQALMDHRRTHKVNVDR